MKKTRQAISFVLNAHLPFVRHPEYPRFLEERWLFEAISECYLPLLRVFERLETDRVPFRLAMSFSPTLCAMLNDDLLRERYIDYLDRMIAFAEREVVRTAGSKRAGALAAFYRDRVVEDKQLFVERYEKDILRAFDYFHKRGHLELLCSAATHAILPFLTPYPEAVQAQIEVAVTQHRSLFGRNPQGFWLPNLAYDPAVEPYLAAYGFEYTLVDSHGLLFGEPAPRMGTLAPVRSSGGLAILGRDLAASHELGDGPDGYRSDPLYRDFYRDVGFELPVGDLDVLLDNNGARVMTGFKYWALGARGAEKSEYDLAAASARVQEHAQAFLKSRCERAAQARESSGDAGICVCAFNAELFGHWWFEGPQFIEAMFRMAANHAELEFKSPADILESRQKLQTVTPEYSTWGTNGYAEEWVDADNDWTYPHISRSIDRMIELAERFPDESGLKERALNQATREIMLAQSSDWAYMLRERACPEYARAQFEDCIRNFTTVYDSLGGNYISTEWLTGLERRHNFFPGINYRMFRQKK